MGVFYTGKGDRGKSTVGKKIMVKDSVISEALGSLDELVSLMGLVKNQPLPKNFKEVLAREQNNLFLAQAHVANALFKGGEKLPDFSANRTARVEKFIDALEAKIKPARKFIIPGRTPNAGWLDYLRAVARRAERNLKAYSKKYPLQEEISAYMNRLSSLFFAMARMEVKRSGKKEIHPSYK